MNIKNKLMPYLAELITSRRLLQLQRQRQQWQRTLSRRPHQAIFYFRVDDPYSVLMAQVLPDFAQHFGIKLVPRVMLYLDKSMYPAADMLAELAPRDVARLAPLHGLDFPANWQLPDATASLAASRCLLKHENSDDFWALANALSSALWRSEADQLTAQLDQHGQLASDSSEARLTRRRDRFLREGHYLTGTVHYAGEWYWSIERLDHLARRLDKKKADSRHWPMPYDLAKRATFNGDKGQLKGEHLTLYFSVRSPYSYLALSRTYALADYYGLSLSIRPVLPMVMRGLSVPKTKRFYILKDAAREARLHGIPFGKVCDPVGLGVERCMAIWPYAEQENRLREWLLTAATGIWSQGIDVADDKGLKQLVERTGLNWHTAQQWLNDDGWRQRADANRDAMMAAGSWGVPSFQHADDIVWGQDRFAVIEAELL